MTYYKYKYGIIKSNIKSRRTGVTNLRFYHFNALNTKIKKT